MRSVFDKNASKIRKIAIGLFICLLVVSLFNKYGKSLSFQFKIKKSGGGDKNRMRNEWNSFMNFSFSNSSLVSPSYSEIYDTTEYSFHLPELRKLCESVQWKNNDTMFMVTPIPMGTFNARNKLMNAVKLSIASGLHLIMPKLLTRSRKNIIHLHPTGDNEFVSVDYLFDSDHLKSVLSINCPQMVVREPEEVSQHIMWKEPSKIEHQGSTEIFRKAVDKVLEEHPKVSIVHTVGLIYLDVNSDGMNFRTDWWRLVRTRPKMVEMADQVVKSFHNQNFGGIHLRLEKDMINRFHDVLDRYNLTFENYAEWSLQFIEKHHKKGDVIFVATGDQELSERMGNLITKRGFVYASKWIWARRIKGLEDHLLDEGWDAVGLIDYHVMLRSTTFVGLEQSTFSYVVALARELYQTNQLGKTIAPNTLLFGPYPSQYTKTIW
eukprot:TRINITY_DN6439_c0_g1_i1.p1 TRINITY_DN6439_c0_g1~~TRINITY_DN6439_c0_g1_i1.p1  ORF type:complete len:435 (-),score=104.02 TRINITY_DN6439_c0_g1_i1:635-1939(-)